MNLREPYAATLTSSLEWSEERERAVDRVAAAGFCDPLGLAIWKARYCLEPVAYRHAIHGLIKAYSERHPHEAKEIVKAVVDQCFHEFLSPFCKSCKGVREMMVNERKVVCDTCGGSGIRRYSDFERARAMRVSLERVKKLQRGLTWLQGHIQDLDRRVNLVMVQQLGRFDE